MEPNNTPRMMQANSFYGPTNPHGVIHEYWATCDQGVLCKRVTVEPAPAIPSSLSHEEVIQRASGITERILAERDRIAEEEAAMDSEWGGDNEVAIPSVDNAPDHHRLMMFNGQRIDQPAHSYRESCCGLKNGRSTCVPLAQFVAGKAPAPEPVKPPRQDDRKILLSVADGPEHIEIYTSEENAIVDWSADVPGLYLTASVNDSCVRLGPFSLKSIRDGVEKALVRELPPPVLLTDELLDGLARIYRESCRKHHYSNSATEGDDDKMQSWRVGLRSMLTEYRKLAGYQEEK